MTNETASPSGWPPHPWLPDQLVDHDAPVCEICGEGMDAPHTGDSMALLTLSRQDEQLTTLSRQLAEMTRQRTVYVNLYNEAEGERDELQSQLAEAQAALRRWRLRQSPAEDDDDASYLEVQAEDGGWLWLMDVHNKSVAASAIRAALLTSAPSGVADA